MNILHIVILYSKVSAICKNKLCYYFYIAFTTDKSDLNMSSIVLYFNNIFLIMDFVTVEFFETQGW